MTAPKDSRRILAMEYLTFNGVEPTAFIDLAVKVGFDAVGLRVSPADEKDHPFDLGPGSARRREVKQALDHSGLRVLDVEVLAVDASTSRESVMPVVESTAFFGADYINVTGNDPDSDRFEQTLHMLADEAGALGIMPLIEPMAWKCLSSVPEAIRLATLVPHLGLQVDSLHFARLGCDPELLRSVPARCLPYIQLSDAPAVAPSSAPLDLQYEGRTARLLPGSGGLPLLDMLAAMPAGCPVAVEVPSQVARRTMSDMAWAQQAHDATLRTIERLRGRPADTVSTSA